MKDNLDKNKIIITVEAYGRKNTVEIPDDSGIYEVIEAFVSQLQFLTFGYGTILNGLREHVQSIENLFEFLKKE